MAATDHEVTEAMLTYGGSFVQALARAYRAADNRNRAKLFVAFEPLFTEYAELHELKARQVAESR